ncbi:MAG TPA: hypothetical protein VNV36_12520 [Pseudomonas sp.]|uniref:hypothetical protein n=1 Tax=Pseudomonas sp. TaxID=306 RepID=UPI002C4D8815|nr:hypothetical protein [Pseudomonas sp.]HWH87585.1 hypothetical protein [Pseudomonas sp.]
MNEQAPQQQNQSSASINRNDPAIDPQTPGQHTPAPAEQGQADSAATEVDQKQHHSDNSNDFSPGFKPDPDRPEPGEDTDADIDTDGG